MQQVRRLPGLDRSGDDFSGYLLHAGLVSARALLEARNIQARSPGLRLAGLILCGIAGAGFLLMMLVLNSFWTVSFLASAVLILTGLAFLAWSLIRNLPSVRAVTE